MSEIFTRSNVNDAAKLPLGLPLASISTSTTDVAWQTCGGDGFWIKPLFEGANGQHRTWIMKVDAGAWSPPHAHEDLEQILVLEGTFYDDEKTYHPGDFVLRAPGAVHTAGSEDGCIVLLIYCPV